MKAKLRALWRALFSFDTLGQTLRSLVLGLLLLAVLAIAALYVYGRIAVQFYKPHTMITLSGKNQTQCVGRYLIDTPLELGRFGIFTSQFIWGLDSNFKSVEVKVEVDDQTQAQFVESTNARISELTTKQNEELKIPLLLAQEVWETPNGKALMLRYLEDDYTSFANIKSDLHVMVGSRHAVITGESYEDEHHKAPGGLHRIAYKFINPKPMEDRLKVIAQNIKGYTDASKAPEGFCMAGVVMNDKTMGYDVETALFNARPDEANLPDTQFSINMEGQFYQVKETLIERADRAAREVKAVMAAAGAQWVDLRKGPRQINGLPGLEFVSATHFSKGVIFQLQVETSLPKDKQSLQRPAFEFELTLGEEKPSPVDQTQALQIWDTLVNSMRLSPANGGQRVDPKTGAMVPPMRVGQACPKAGTWEASLPPGHPAAGLLASAASRFVQVQAGQVMPEVYASFMSRTADADNAQVVWTLVRAV
jgi:hypothetical protein